MDAWRKAIGGVQPYPTLAVLGEKRIWTMPHDLAAAGVEPGERVALVSLNEHVLPGAKFGDMVTVGDGRYGQQWLGREGTDTHVDLPLGAMVGTVVVDDALPIVENPEQDRTLNQDRCLFVDNTLRLFTEGWDAHPLGPFPAHKAEPLPDQLPLGNFTPGGWGWLLSGARPLTKRCPFCYSMPWFNTNCAGCRNRRTLPADPIPCKGRQGVFELPADVAEALS